MNINEFIAPYQILLADDDVDDRLFFARALKAIPIATQLTIVNDGEEVMRYLFENSDRLPTVLFLDLSMPRKNGFECLIEIRDNKKLEGLPIVLFTTSFKQNIGYEQTLIKTMQKIGVQEYVAKTADLLQLQKIIHSALVVAIDNKLLNDQG